MLQVFVVMFMITGSHNCPLMSEQIYTEYRQSVKIIVLFQPYFTINAYNHKLYFNLWLYDQMSLECVAGCFEEPNLIL